jgi:hypothetical protein
MRQTWHIFRKDTRYLWREAIVLLALAAVFGWAESRGSMAGAISDAMEPLFIVVAGFTIARLIHAEAIPGENQFWITRPYRWQSLLGAKLLFVLAFMNLPVLLAQAAILMVNRFSVGAILPGLLWTQVLIGVCVLLPLVVLATLTETMIQFIGSPLATAFLAFVIIYFVRDLNWNLIMTPTGIEWLRDAILFIALAAMIPPALYFQYKLRRTELTRMVTIGIAACAVAIYLTVHWQTLFRVQSYFSRQNTDAVKVSLDPGRKFSLVRGGSILERLRPGGTSFQLTLPFSISGVPDGANAQFEGFGVTLATAGGRVLPFGNTRLHIEKSALLGDLWMDAKSFEAQRGRPLTLRASLWLTVFGNKRKKDIMLNPVPQDVMDGVQCYDIAFNQLVCRSPFRWPNRLVSQNNVGEARNPLTGLISYSPFPASLQLDPIVSKSPVYYSREPEAERTVTMAVEEPLAYLQRDLEVRGLELR